MMISHYSLQKWLASLATASGGEQQGAAAGRAVGWPAACQAGTDWGAGGGLLMTCWNKRTRLLQGHREREIIFTYYFMYGLQQHLIFTH